MKTKASTPPDSSELRSEAEKKLLEQKKKNAEPSPNSADTQKLLHELQVHQIELEMQNEELVLSRADAEVLLRQFTNLYDFSPVGYLTLTRDGTIQNANLTSARMLGEQRGRLIKRRFGLFVSRESRPIFNTFLDKVFLTPNVKMTCEITLETKEGGPLWVQIESTSEDGLQCNTVLIDITERKLAKETLATTERLYRMLIENISDGIALVDRQNTVIYVSPSVSSVIGYSEEELLDSFLPRIHPDDLPKVIANFTQGFATNEVVSASCRVRHSDGSWRWLEGSAVNRLNDPAIGAIIATFRDVTKQKQIEEELRIKDQAVRSSLNAIAIADAVGNLTYVNAAFLSLWGYDHEDEVLGKSAVEFWEAKEKAAEIVTALQNSNGWTGELIAKRKDNSPFYVELVGSPLKDENNRLTGMVGAFVDITARKQAETALKSERALLAERVQERTAELSHTNTELAQALRIKDEFLATMSHELRTPLNAILGLSESLIEELRGPLNERQLDAIQNIEVSGRHLLTLINDILDLSKIETGHLELDSQSVPLMDICQASLMFVKESAAKKSISLSLNIDGLLTTFQADLKRLKQMLVNLLSNAVKFTPEGGKVNLEVNSSADGSTVLFTVRDTGIGITQEHMPRLFHPFVQLDSSLSRRYEGSGLGLALVRRLAELHGGSVSVESEIGKGSAFTIALPYQNQKPKSMETKPITPTSTHPNLQENISQTPPRKNFVPAQKRVLLVEDNEINITAVGEYLEDRGYIVSFARNGNEAIRMAQETHPNIILMDIQMPELDGIEATQRLRMQAEFAVTPIVALTALAMPGDRERCLAAGVNEYLSKPVALKELVQTIDRLTAI